MDFFKILIYFILICVALFFVRKFLGRFKIPKTGCLVPINGGVKSGKSTVSCAVVYANYKRSLRSIKFANFFRRLFRKEPFPLPVIYSNVPLNLDYVPVTRDMLLLNVKPIRGSVMYLQEASLLADSQLIKDKDVNNQLLLFFKLCGHVGYKSVVLDTQQISDIHYSIKRSASQCFYVRSLVKWIPFFLIAEVLEYTYSEDGSIIFAQNKDMDEIVKKVLIRKSIWKKFDAYAYSSIVDNKPFAPSNIIKKGSLKDLKVNEIVSFRDDFNLKLRDVELKDNTKK